MHLLRLLAREGVAPVVRRTIPIAAPAVAVGWTFTPQNGRAWQVMSLYTSLVADANVADRRIRLALTDGTNTLWQITSGEDQVASATTGYTFAADWPTTNRNFDSTLIATAIPTAILLPGWTLTLTITNVQAGDQLAATNVQVLEAFVGRTEHEYDKARALADRLIAAGEFLQDEVPGL